MVHTVHNPTAVAAAETRLQGKSYAIKVTLSDGRKGYVFQTDNGVGMTDDLNLAMVSQNKFHMAQMAQAFRMCNADASFRLTTVRT
jgi:hypothetical protein